MRAAERIVCEAMKAASPIQTVARVGGEFKCTRLHSQTVVKIGIVKARVVTRMARRQLLM